MSTNTWLFVMTGLCFVVAFICVYFGLPADHPNGELERQRW
jgi:hypothetical protein